MTYIHFFGMVEIYTSSPVGLGGAALWYLQGTKTFTVKFDANKGSRPSLNSTATGVVKQEFAPKI